MTFDVHEAAVGDTALSTPVSLDEVREGARRFRDAQSEVADLTERLAAATRRLNDLRSVELPDLMAQAGVDRLGLPAEGNHPTYDLILKPFYKANIAADWDPDRREVAFGWLEREGHGDVIRRVVTVGFKRGPEERERAARLARLLRTEGYDFAVAKDVPWATLTALVKGMCEDYAAACAAGEELEPPPLDLLGATVGRVVEMRQRREKAPPRRDYL